MWIVNGEIFESQKLAKARASDLNKTHALIHNLDVDNPPEIYKPKQVIHYSEDVNRTDTKILCNSTVSKLDRKFFSSIFPHMVTCPKCNQLLDELDED